MTIAQIKTKPPLDITPSITTLSPSSKTNSKTNTVALGCLLLLGAYATIKIYKTISAKQKTVPAPPPLPKEPGWATATERQIVHTIFQLLPFITPDPVLLQKYEAFEKQIDSYLSDRDSLLLDAKEALTLKPLDAGTLTQIFMTKKKGKQELLKLEDFSFDIRIAWIVRFLETKEKPQIALEYIQTIFARHEIKEYPATATDRNIVRTICQILSLITPEEIFRARLKDFERTMEKQPLPSTRQELFHDLKTILTFLRGEDLVDVDLEKAFSDDKKTLHDVSFPIQLAWIHKFMETKVSSQDALTYITEVFSVLQKTAPKTDPELLENLFQLLEHSFPGEVAFLTSMQRDPFSKERWEEIKKHIDTMALQARLQETDASQAKNFRDLSPSLQIAWIQQHVFDTKDPLQALQNIQNVLRTFPPRKAAAAAASAPAESGSPKAHPPTLENLPIGTTRLPGSMITHRASPVPIDGLSTLPS